MAFPSDKTPKRQPGDLILDHYMPNATSEQRKEARENLRRLARLLIRVHEREQAEREHLPPPERAVSAKSRAVYCKASMNFAYGDGDDFDVVKQDAEALYDAISSVPCPYFSNDAVAFNAKGIRHLKFKSDEKARSRQDQYARLKLLYLAEDTEALPHRAGYLENAAV